jgi:DNA adenine methylase
VKATQTKSVKPFLKWVGGKGQLLGQFESLYPEKYDSYFEPFVGGGAVYFSLAPKIAHINDINQTLVQTYTNIKTDVEKLIEELKDLEQDFLAKDIDDRKVMYYDIRTKYNLLEPDAFERSLYFLFFNKTAFNGVYRENSKGGFNVPIGSYANPKIVDENNLRLVSQALSKTTITNLSYFDAVSKAKAGDFVYLDPPYHPLSETSSFTNYSKDSFSKDDQVNLRDLFVGLDKRGVYVMLSNSSAPFIQELYSEYKQISVFASRMINSKAEKRGKISEVVVTNYELSQNLQNVAEISLNTAPQYQYQ